MLVLPLEGADLVLLDLQTGIPVRLKALLAQYALQSGWCCSQGSQGTKAV